MSVMTDGFFGEQFITVIQVLRGVCIKAVHRERWVTCQTVKSSKLMDCLQVRKTAAHQAGTFYLCAQIMWFPICWSWNSRTSQRWIMMSIFSTKNHCAQNAGGRLVLDQSFVYDELNRLTSATEGISGVTQKQTIRSFLRILPSVELE